MNLHLNGQTGNENFCQGKNALAYFVHGKGDEEEKFFGGFRGEFVEHLSPT
jgi:hypothetical protein